MSLFCILRYRETNFQEFALTYKTSHLSCDINSRVSKHFMLRGWIWEAYEAARVGEGTETVLL